jgi:hypothetical protein
MDEADPFVRALGDSVRRAIQAGKDHQIALKLYTERLEAELQTVDKLLVCSLTFPSLADVLLYRMLQTS